MAEPKLTDANKAIAEIMEQPQEATPIQYPNTGEIEGTFTPAAWNFLRSAAAARAQTALNEAHTIAQTPTSFLNPNIEFDAQSIDILQTIGTQADFLQGKISELLNEPFVSALHKPWPAEVHGQPRSGIKVAGPAEESRPPSAKPK